MLIVDMSRVRFVILRPQIITPSYVPSSHRDYSRLISCSISCSFSLMIDNDDELQARLCLPRFSYEYVLLTYKEYAIETLQMLVVDYTIN